MADFYTEMQTEASELLVEFAQGTIAYVQMTPQAGATPDEPLPSVAVSTALAGAVARGVQYKYVMRGLAVASDLQVVLAGDALSVSPSIGDFVDIDSVRYKIMQIVSNPAAGIVVTYTLIVRK